MPIFLLIFYYLLFYIIAYNQLGLYTKMAIIKIFMSNL